MFNSSEFKKSIEAKGLAIGLVLAFGGIALAGCSSEKVNADPKPSTSHSAEATPSSKPTEAYTPPEADKTAAEIAIPNTVAPEEAAKQIVQRIGEWEMAGTTKENEQKFFAAPAGTTDDQFSAEVAAAEAPAYIEALFPEHYQSSAHLSQLVSDEQHNNTRRFEDWIITDPNNPAIGPNPADKEQYTASFDNITVAPSQSATGTGNDFLVSFTNHNNSAENRIGSQYDPAEVAQNGEKVTIKMSLIDEDGKWLINDWQLWDAESGN